MSKLGWHACISLVDRRPLYPRPVEQRAFARTLLEIGRDHGLVLFNGSDDHGHVVVAGEARPRFGRLVRDVLGVSRLRPGTTLAQLVDSAAAALALPGIAGNQEEAVAARRAAVRIGRDLGLQTAAIASLLGLGRRACSVSSSSQPQRM